MNCCSTSFFAFSKLILISPSDVLLALASLGTGLVGLGGVLAAWIDWSLNDLQLELSSTAANDGEWEDDVAGRGGGGGGGGGSPATTL